MKQLRALNNYFWKYRWRFLLGIIFILLSNYFRILAPQLTGYLVDQVQLSLLEKKDEAAYLAKSAEVEKKQLRYDTLVKNITVQLEQDGRGFGSMVLICGLVLIFLAVLGGFFMFLMRQTIIVMSRHIEFDQKNEIFNHYQQLDAGFYRTRSTGDLMSRISEDVSRVRMYSGPAIMYFINLAATIGFSVYFMLATQPLLTLYVLAPLPLLALIIYKVNTIINRRSERIQKLLSDLTTNAQESYSGIRVIKSFVQERSMLDFFDRNSNDYKQNAIGLAKVESLYFPSMALLIGLSTLLTIMIGGFYAIQGTHNITLGTITEFVMYINMLTFPVMAIGWTASMIQRAAASQKRINEFLDTEPAIKTPEHAVPADFNKSIVFDKVDFTYSNTGIHALKSFSLEIRKGQKLAIVGHTGSGKTTIAQLLLRLFDPGSGRILSSGTDIRQVDLRSLRAQVSYVPQDVFLFSDTISNNISFGRPGSSSDEVKQAARQACVEKDILGFSNQYETMIGERGVTLSGGQKQRISIARALIKNPEVIVLDDCLSAVDTHTEKEILNNLNLYLKGKTAIVITHRIFSMMDFDNIIVLEDGAIVESGRHHELMAMDGAYADLYRLQQQQEKSGVAG